GACVVDLGRQDVPVVIAEGLGHQLQALAVGDGEPLLAEARAQRAGHGLCIAKIAHGTSFASDANRKCVGVCIADPFAWQRPKREVRYVSPTPKSRRRRAVSTRRKASDRGRRLSISAGSSESF